MILLELFLVYLLFLVCRISIGLRCLGGGLFCGLSNCQNTSKY